MKEGDKVRYIGTFYDSYMSSRYYPKIGTVGVILEIHGKSVLVDWGKESGVVLGVDNKYAWYVNDCCLEVVQ